jgi:hypothetical protein
MPVRQGTGVEECRRVEGGRREHSCGCPSRVPDGSNSLDRTEQGPIQLPSNRPTVQPSSFSGSQPSPAQPSRAQPSPARRSLAQPGQLAAVPRLTSLPSARRRYPSVMVALSPAYGAALTALSWHDREALPGWASPPGPLVPPPPSLLHPSYLSYGSGCSILVRPLVISFPRPCWSSLLVHVLGVFSCSGIDFGWDCYCYCYWCCCCHSLQNTRGTSVSTLCRDPYTIVHATCG